MKQMLALLLSIGIANAADAPELKEGLWSIHKQSIDNPGNKKSDTTSTICRNHAYDQHVKSLSKERKGCTVKESVMAGKHINEAHCLIAGTMIESKGTSTFQGAIATHSEFHTTYTPAFSGIKESTTIMDQKYIGACPAGSQPGDLTTAGGKVTHLGQR